MGNLCSKSGRISKPSKTFPGQRGKHSSWVPVNLPSEEYVAREEESAATGHERDAKIVGADIIVRTPAITTDTSGTLNDEVETKAGPSCIKVELTGHSTNTQETERLVGELSGMCTTPNN